MRRMLNRAAWSLYWRAFELAPAKFQWLKTLASLHPGLYMPLARTLYESSNATGRDITGRDVVSRRVLQEGTEIVIEGAPRSANTFAVAAFKLAQTRPVKTAYRLHAAAHVIAAVEMDVPTLVLIRDPEDATLSYVVQQSKNGLGIGIEQALKTWIRFYERILPYRDQFVLGRFDTVIDDFGVLIRKVNDAFGTCFDEFDHCESNVQTCFRLVEEGYERQRFDESGISVPSEKRDALKDALRRQFRDEGLRALRERAYMVHQRMTSGCVQ